MDVADKVCVRPPVSKFRSSVSTITETRRPAANAVVPGDGGIRTRISISRTRTFRPSSGKGISCGGIALWCCGLSYDPRCARPNAQTR